MTSTDDDVVTALANLGMYLSDATVYLADIRDGQPGTLEVHFYVPATKRRSSILVPLPSSDGEKPWLSHDVVTSHDWARSFHRWLEEQVGSGSL